MPKITIDKIKDWTREIKLKWKFSFPNQKHLYEMKDFGSEELCPFRKMWCVRWLFFPFLFCCFSHPVHRGFHLSEYSEYFHHVFVVVVHGIVHSVSIFFMNHFCKFICADVVDSQTQRITSAYVPISFLFWSHGKLASKTFPKELQKTGAAYVIMNCLRIKTVQTMLDSILMDTNTCSNA